MICSERWVSCETLIRFAMLISISAAPIDVLSEGVGKNMLTFGMNASFDYDVDMDILATLRKNGTLKEK